MVGFHIAGHIFLALIIIVTKLAISMEMRTVVVYQIELSSYLVCLRPFAKQIKEHRSVLMNGHPERYVCCCRAFNEYGTYRPLEQHSNKGCNALANLSEMHPGDLAHEESAHPINWEEASYLVYTTCSLLRTLNACTGHHHLKIDLLFVPHPLFEALGAYVHVNHAEIRISYL